MHEGLSSAQGEVSSPDKLANKLFLQMDANGDGIISWEEFRAGALNDPSVLRLLNTA